jgi:(p)ppGpp synthase/HD superfamily hydrolase
MLTARFDEAFRYAHDVHRVQPRKGLRIPYIAHLMDVAAIVLQYGGSEDEAIGALLHDAAEDHGGRERLADIRQRFGDVVAEIVEGCSDTFEVAKPAWIPRKRSYISHMTDPGTAPRVLLVSAADKLANARAILADWRRHGDKVFERFTGRKHGTLWYYRGLVNAFRKRGEASIAHIVEELDRVVTELQRLAQMEGDLPEPS